VAEGGAGAGGVVSVCFARCTVHFRRALQQAGSGGGGLKLEGAPPSSIHFQGWGESGDGTVNGNVTNIHITDVNLDGPVPR